MARRKSSTFASPQSIGADHEEEEKDIKKRLRQK
jgi:hypothetical protein